MQICTLTDFQIVAYKQYLQKEERSNGTVEKYLRDIRSFLRFLNGRAVTKELTALWKEELLARGYAPVTVNTMLSALNSLFTFLGCEEYREKFLKIQRKLFRERSRELTKEEYRKLVTAAKSLGKTASPFCKRCANNESFGQPRYCQRLFRRPL